MKRYVYATVVPETGAITFIQTCEGDVYNRNVYLDLKEDTSDNSVWVFMEWDE